MLDMKPGDSGMVIGYHVDEFTQIWLVEHFVAQLPIYPGFTGIMVSLTHFPLELGCEDYSFLDQAIVHFEQGPDFIITDSIETPVMDA